MNGVNGAMPGLWQEAQAPDGRTYYYNTLTKATQWTKPVDLMTPAERALADQPWKEYTAENGRKYWAHAETKVTTWSMPEEYRNALAAAEASAQAPQFVAGGGGSFAPWAQQRERERDRERDNHFERVGPDRQVGYRDEPRGPVFIKADDPNYNSYEEAEAAFMKMLRKNNVQPDWNWNQAMRATILDPQYRSIKDPRDRKAAFEKFVVEQRAQEQEREKERLAKLRADFGLMLRTHPEIKHYTRWKTAKPILAHETIFRSTDNDDERRALFEEYIVELKKAHVEHEAQVKKSAMDELQTILKNLQLEPYTRWAEAHPLIEQHERFVGDNKFKTLNKSDVLTAFENHIKTLERLFNDERQREKASKARKERQNRDAFAELLRELRNQGKIKAGTKWKQVHAEIEHDPRYINMLGQAGSSPLELFWDVVEEEDKAMRGVRNLVYDVLEDKRYEVTTKTSFDEFREAIADDRRTMDIPQDDLTLIFQRLIEKIKRREEKKTHASEVEARRKMDDLRSRMKHLNDPPIRASSNWEEVKLRLEHLNEYKALDEDQCKYAFDKHIRRLKEKEEDDERRREKRERDRDRDRERERERDARRRARVSHSPDPDDAYAAERRKAMAERERQYHKSGSTGLSPPVRERERERDRYDRYRGRDEGRLREFSRERDRDRRRRDPDDEERERLYRLRGDPRASRDELDYGGGAPPSSSGRRRRDSDANSVGSRKRTRYERSPRRRREESEKEKEFKKEEVAMHSGSEEGEMVED